MTEKWFDHPERLPKNAPGPFYTTGYRDKNGVWSGNCLWCGLPEAEAPELLAPLNDGNDDTYFIKQPETAGEIEDACSALEICCAKALRYGGKDLKILKRLDPDLCDYGVASVEIKSDKWWHFWS